MKKRSGPGRGLFDRGKALLQDVKDMAVQLGLQPRRIEAQSFNSALLGEVVQKFIQVRSVDKTPDVATFNSQDAERVGWPELQQLPPEVALQIISQRLKDSIRISEKKLEKIDQFVEFTKDHQKKIMPTDDDFEFVQGECDKHLQAIAIDAQYVKRQVEYYSKLMAGVETFSDAPQKLIDLIASLKQIKFEADTNRSENSKKNQKITKEAMNTPPGPTDSEVSLGDFIIAPKSSLPSEEMKPDSFDTMVADRFRNQSLYTSEQLEVASQLTTSYL